MRGFDGLNNGTGMVARRDVKSHALSMSMVEAKWVRIMCDYCADPLWGPNGGMEVLEGLPVPEDLRERLRAWAALYDAQDPGSPDGIRLDLLAFAEEGRSIARAVKAALPDWTVIYFDEEAATNRPPDAPRETFEYEIGL